MEKQRPKRYFHYPLSGLSLSANRITGHNRIFEWMTKARMIICACAGWSESAHVAHFRMHGFAWHDPIDKDVILFYTFLISWSVNYSSLPSVWTGLKVVHFSVCIRSFLVRQTILRRNNDESWLRDYKTFFMLNSSEHDIYFAYNLKVLTTF